MSYEPDPRLIRSAADAEEAACAWMRAFGFVDARLTGIGADGGVDIVAEEVVAQVKAEMTPTGRPAVQALHGIAAFEGKLGAFFSLSGFTRQALEWATQTNTACFQFDLQGQPTPLNLAGYSLMQAATDRHALAPLPFSNDEAADLQPLGLRVYMHLSRSREVYPQVVGWNTSRPSADFPVWIIRLFLGKVEAEVYPMALDPEWFRRPRRQVPPPWRCSDLMAVHMSKNPGISRHEFFRRFDSSVIAGGDDHLTYSAECGPALSEISCNRAVEDVRRALHAFGAKIEDLGLEWD
jgi:hypothetical protein